MNRRELLKAAIAAPVVAAFPWYSEPQLSIGAIRRVKASLKSVSFGDHYYVAVSRHFVESLSDGEKQALRLNRTRLVYL